MKDEVDSFKDELKNRLTSPFIGKLILTWLIWNWQIVYVTFFVDENNLKPKNRLEFISDYLSSNDYFNLLKIHVIPLLITCFLVWVFPYFSDLADKANNKFRKKKALNKKETDDEITGHKEAQIKSLEEEIDFYRNRSIEDLNKIREIILLTKYLSEEPDLVNKKDYDELITQYLKKYKDEIIENNFKDKVSSLMEDFHKTDKESHFNNINKKELKFLITNYILTNDNGTHHLTKYGEFISKNILYDKYQFAIPFFHKNIKLNE